MRERNARRVTVVALVLALVAPAGAATAAPRGGDRDGRAAFFAGGSVWKVVEAAFQRIGLFSSTSDPAGEEPEPSPPPAAEDEGGDPVELDPPASSNLGPEMDPYG